MPHNETPRPNKAYNMELSINDEKVKELFAEIITEMLKTKKSILYDIVQEVLEDIGLANAITEGRKNEFVSEDEILSIINKTSQ